MHFRKGVRKMDIKDLSCDIQVYLEHISTNVNADLEYIKRVENFKSKAAVLDNYNIYKIKIITHYNVLSTLINIENCYCKDIIIPKYMNNIYVYLPVTLKIRATRSRVESIGRLIIDNAEQLHSTFKYNSRDVLPLLRYNKLYVNNLKSFNRWMIELLEDLISEANNSENSVLNSYTIRYIMEVRNQLKLRNNTESFNKTKPLYVFFNIKDNIQNYDRHKETFNKALEDLKEILL